MLSDSAHLVPREEVLGLLEKSSCVATTPRLFFDHVLKVRRRYVA